MSEIEEGNEPQDDVLGLLDELGKEPEPNEPDPKVDEPDDTLDDDGVLDDSEGEEIAADDEEIDEKTALELGLIEKPEPKPKAEEKPKVEETPKAEAKGEEKPAPTPYEELQSLRKAAAERLSAIEAESALIQDYFDGVQNIKGYAPFDSPGGISEKDRKELSQRLRDNSQQIIETKIYLRQQEAEIGKKIEAHAKTVEAEKAHGAKVEYLDYREAILDRFIADYKHLGAFREKLAVNFDKAFRAGKLSDGMSTKDFVDVVAGSVIREEIKKRRDAKPKRNPNAAHAAGVIEDEAKTPKSQNGASNGAAPAGLIGAEGISAKTMERIYAAYEREYSIDWRTLECAEDVTDLVEWYKGKVAKKK